MKTQRKERRSTYSSFLYPKKFIPIQDRDLCRKVDTGSSTVKSWGPYSWSAVKPIRSFEWMTKHTLSFHTHPGWLMLVVEMSELKSPTRTSNPIHPKWNFCPPNSLPSYSNPVEEWKQPLFNHSQCLSAPSPPATWGVTKPWPLSALRIPPAHPLFSIPNEILAMPSQLLPLLHSWPRGSIFNTTAEEIFASYKSNHVSCLKP